MTKDSTKSDSPKGFSHPNKLKTEGKSPKSASNLLSKPVALHEKIMKKVLDIFNSPFTTYSP